MARHESDREDLLREATALVDRIELAPLDAVSGETVTVGFRRGGAASFFFGAGPVYQFNQAGELRRAFANGLLLKAVHGRLVALRRSRQSQQVQLLRTELTSADQAEFLSEMADRLRILARGLAAGKYSIVGMVPANGDVLGRAQAWLAENTCDKVAAAPNVHSGS